MSLLCITSAISKRVPTVPKGKAEGRGKGGEACEGKQPTTHSSRPCSPLLVFNCPRISYVTVFQFLSHSAFSNSNFGLGKNRILPIIRVCVCEPYREPLLRVDFYHAPKQVLAVWRHEVRDMEHASLHLLQQLTEVVVVEGQCTHQEGVQDHATRPHVRPPPVVLLPLHDDNMVSTTRF